MSDQSNGVGMIEGLESLARLEERILATVEQLRAARREKEQAEREAAQLRIELASSEQRARQAVADLESFRAERRQIGERLEQLLIQIDLLTKE